MIGAARPAVRMLRVEVKLDGLEWRLGAGVDMTSVLGASLNLDVYNHVKNSHDEDTMNGCGSCLLPLLRLATTAGGRSETVPLFIPGERAHKLTRGKLSYAGVQLLLDGRPLSVQIEAPLRAQMLERVECRDQETQQLLAGPIARWQAAFSALQPCAPCLQGINALYYDGRRCRVPLPGYICRPPPADTVAYYQHALRLVLARLDLDEAQWLAMPTSCPAAGVPVPVARCGGRPERVLTEVLGLSIHFMPYLLDQVGDGADPRTGKMHRRNIESFDWARALLKLDCEDGTQETLLEFLVLAQQLAPQQCSPALAKLILLARSYVPFSWLVGVSSYEINMDALNEVDDMAAHMHAALVPLCLWERWTSAHRQLPAVPWASQQARLDSSWSPGVVIIESTGFLNGSADDPALDERSALYTVVGSVAGTGWRNARKEYGIYRDRPSSFYKMLVMAYTPAYADSGYCAFVPQTTSALQLYGLRFQDVLAPLTVAANAGMCMTPLSPLTAAELQAVRRAGHDDYPLCSLQPPDPHRIASQTKQSDAIATQLLSTLQSLCIKNGGGGGAGGSSGGSGGSGGGDRLVECSWFVAYREMTPAAAEALIKGVRFAMMGERVGYRPDGGGDGAERQFTAWLRGARVQRLDVRDRLGGYLINLEVAWRN